jgi:hypothetical protein
VRVLGIYAGVGVSGAEESWLGRVNKRVGVYRTVETRLGSLGRLWRVGRVAESRIAWPRLDARG